MLGDISPQTVRITQQAVVYPGRDHVTSLRVERFDGRTYKPVDMTAVTRVILSFPEADPVIVYDSSVQAVFTHVGTTLTVDLSDYAMPASVLGCQIILYDAEHPAGQVLVDDIDAVVQFDFRNVSPVGGIPAPAVDYLTDAPIDGVTYARKDGVWVPADAPVSGVSSVNGQSGVVVLDAADVGADPAGTATTAAAAAVAAHTALADPHPQYLTPTEANVAYERVLTAGANITIDRTNPAAPVISASGGGGAGGAVDSVNGQTGVVVLDTDDIAEGVSNLYFTNGRAAAAAPVQTVDGQTGAVSLSSSYAPLSHVGDGGAAHSNAVAAGAAGFMTGADKAKLDGIAAGASANPMTTAGDIIVGGVAGAPARLALGTEGQILAVVGDAPAWVEPELNTSVRVYSEEPVSPVPYQLFMIVLPPDVTAPTVTAFTATSGVASPVPITAFTATDAVGVTGYWVGQSSATPSLGDPNWSPTSQTSFTTASTGSVTLYARARDAAGNISSALSQAVTIPASENYLTVSWPYNSGYHTDWLSCRSGAGIVVRGAQSIVPASTINALAVDVTVRSRKDAFVGTGSLRLSIVDDASNTPGTTVLAEATLTDFTTASNSFETRRFALSATALTSGVKYWLLMEVVGPSGDCCYQWANTPSDPYAAGVAAAKTGSDAWAVSTGDQACRVVY